MNITLTDKNKNLIVWAFAVPMLFRLVMSTQGIDSTDVGFCNTFYQAIFDAPDTNEFNFIYYLTGFLGGCWEKIFGKFGLMGFRIFELFTLSVSVFCLYSIYKDKMRRKLCAAAVFLSLLFPIIIVTFHYDTLSYLLVALAALMFSKHVEIHKGYLWITLAGVFIGISFFARIVNFSFCVLAILPLLYKGEIGGGINQASA